MSPFKKESIMKPFSRIISVINVTIALFFISTSYAHDAVKNHKKPVAKDEANVILENDGTVLWGSGDYWGRWRITNEPVLMSSITTGKDQKGQNQYVAVGSGSRDFSGVIYTSSDAIHWTRTLATHTPNWFTSIIWADNQYVAVGGWFQTKGNEQSIVNEENYIYTSTNGIDWIPHRVNGGSRNETLTSVTWASDLHRYFAIGEHSTFTTSADSINWSDMDSLQGVGDYLRAIIRFNQFYILSSGDSKWGAYISSDGKNWTHPLDPSTHIRAFAVRPQ